MQERAKAEGWALVTMLDNGDPHPMWDVIAEGPKFKNNREAVLAVIDAAKRGGILHQHALKLVTSSRVRKPKAKK